MTDWNANDPEAIRVMYDLSGWDFDQQAALAAELAEAEIPHGWDGTELAVPEQFEAAADAVFTALEARLGIAGADNTALASAEAELAADASLTEYDLSDWDALERSLVSDSLIGAGVPFRWEGEVLLVPTDAEEHVDGILDEVENGDIIPIMNDAPEADELPFETLNNFFLAGERLRREPRDATGLERLLDALKVADTSRPPRGVELGVWRRSCQLADELADALVNADGDYDDAKPVAQDLHDLLRPLI
ncbi:unannotated protein [freshwater metagenome]|uniref:Unannotated protein n=1 Tax=freshwater metagenome TaxID=449393 RepID=A0A6J7ER64_9ZZZZ|nr:hypothetical protein [Actinomycetota bacterium]